LDFTGAITEAQAIAAASAQLGFSTSPLDLHSFIERFTVLLRSLKRGSIVVFDNLFVDFPNGQLGNQPIYEGDETPNFDSCIDKSLEGVLSKLSNFINEVVLIVGRKFTYDLCIGTFVILFAPISNVTTPVY
jgi:hypothetical protein